MKKLIICEKPSLAKNVCSALALMGESATRLDGYFETPSYFVAPAFGHLFTLCGIEEYNPNYNPEEKHKWTLDVLPFVPESFMFRLKTDPKTRKADAGVKKQFGVLKALVNSKEVEEIINCGDADREGEIIVRIILDQAGNKKAVKRLWIPDQTEQTIMHGLKTLHRSQEYDALAAEGYARMYVDWLYGINLTRYASIKYGTMLRIGRVIGAIVKAICERDRAIRTFKPVTYYQPISDAETNGCKILLSSKFHFDVDKKDDAAAQCADYNALGAVVKDKTTKEQTISSPKLFSQSGLQNVLSKRYGFAPDKTLSLVQALYEAGYVSYPRTPTEYLATAEKEKTKHILNAIGDGVVFKDHKRIFDDSKIESHSAITPTSKIPKEGSINGDEKSCYDTIFNRFCAVFSAEDCIEEKTTITIAVGDKEDFTLTGSVPIKAGWKAYDQPEKEDGEQKELPVLAIGDKVNINFAPKEKQTQPPKHYSVETLNNYLRDPFKDEKKTAETDDEEYKNLLAGLEIGTEATRSGIIKTAIDSQYIELTKSTYKILPAGEALVDTMDKLNIDMSKQKTALMGKAVKDVFRGNKSIADVVALTSQELSTIINQQVEIERFSAPGSDEKESFGACPRCGKPVVETPRAYSCSFGSECGFALWKDNKFLSGAKKKLTGSMVKSLLKTGSVSVKGLTAKSGKKYDCTVVLEDTGKYVNLKPNFNG
jgi:DNA topoisomerase-3